MPRRAPMLLAGLAIGVLLLLAGSSDARTRHATRSKQRVAVRHRAAVRRRAVPRGTALTLSPLSADDGYLQTALREFDSFTPENEMKFDVLRPTRTHWDFTGADAIVDFATRYGKQIHGHTLIWGQQLPDWLARPIWTRDALLSILRDHVATVVGRYRGRVPEWDVVNEPMANDGTLAQSVWMRDIGPDYIAAALRAAHDADPTAKLFINEIGAEQPSPKRDGLLALAKSLLAQGVPLDGIGLQNHATITSYADKDVLAGTMREFAALGLQVEVTEMDVRDVESGLSVATRLSRQAAVFGDAAAACNEVKACSRFTVWGVGDSHSWIGSDQVPLLFDSDYLAKPALDAVAAAFAPRR